MCHASRWALALLILFAAAISACQRAAPPVAAPTPTSPAAPTLPAPTATRPASVQVAAIQFRTKFGDPVDNRKRLEPYIRTAAGHGAKIVVLPETAITGYTSEELNRTWHLKGRTLRDEFTGVDPLPVAETVPGPSTDQLGKLAGELKIYLTVPFVERAGEGENARYYNTIVLLDPAGKIALHYRKLNPWPYAEIGWATPGDRGHPVLDTPYGRLGLLVCFDINFEPSALHKLQVDTLLYCIAWVDDENSRWFYRDLPGIAQRNDINIIGANWTVTRHTDWSGYGHSLIITRKGNVLTRAADDLKEEILYATLPVK